MGWNGLEKTFVGSKITISDEAIKICIDYNKIISLPSPSLSFDSLSAIIHSSFLIKIFFNILFVFCLLFLLTLLRFSSFFSFPFFLNIVDALCILLSLSLSYSLLLSPSSFFSLRVWFIQCGLSSSSSSLIFCPCSLIIHPCILLFCTSSTSFGVQI